MLSNDIIGAVLSRAVSTGGDYAEIFAENSLSGNIVLKDRSVETAAQNRIFGAGIRVFKGKKSVFASTNDMTLSGLLAAAEKAADAIGSLRQDVSVTVTDRLLPNIHTAMMIGSSVPYKRKTQIALTAAEAALGYSGEIAHAQIVLHDKDTERMIATTEGFKLCDRQVRTRLSVAAVASLGGENQTGFDGPGAGEGYEFFERVDPAKVGVDAARQAVVMLHAGYCPAGRMPVVIDNAFGGVIFHEACGHSLEAEAVSRGLSQFSGKLGQQIANEKVSAVDDGTIPNAWGSLNFDDEGTPTKRNLLIENGILKSYMVDKMGSRRMGLPLTGSGRREAYYYAPVSRMTNTFILPGNDREEDMIASVGYGLYAKKMGGGSVNPVSGEFNFSVREGYLIRDGKICEPVRGASLIGKGSEVLMNIDMVGSNLERAQGMCGASSGSIPVDVGQPMIRVSEITVGGR